MGTVRTCDGLALALELTSGDSSRTAADLDVNGPTVAHAPTAWPSR